MKIRTDEHVSPRIVEAIRKIALSPGWEITSIHDVNETGSSDVYWITKFSQSGGNAILSADKDFLKHEPQVNAVFETGLKVIHLPSKWAQAERHMQAAHILQWWRRIELKLEEMKQRECYRPEWNIRESGQLRKIKIDFSKAQKTKKKVTKQQKKK